MRGSWVVLGAGVGTAILTPPGPPNSSATRYLTERIAASSGRSDVASCVLIGPGSIPSPRPLLAPLPPQAIGARGQQSVEGVAARVCLCLRIIRRDQSTEDLCQAGPSNPFKRAMWRRGRSGVAFSVHEAQPSADNRAHRTSPTVNPSGLLS